MISQYLPWSNSWTNGNNGYTQWFSTPFLSDLTSWHFSESSKSARCCVPGSVSRIGWKRGINEAKVQLPYGPACFEGRKLSHSHRLPLQLCLAPWFANNSQWKADHSRESRVQRKSFITSGKIKFTYHDDNSVVSPLLINILLSEGAFTNGREWNLRISTVKIKFLCV